MKNKILFVVQAARWFDRKYGNTYTSTNITRVKDGKKLFSPLEYGYGEFYRQQALAAMEKAGWLPKKYTVKGPSGMTRSYMYERENGYPIIWNVSDTTKKEAEQNGKE